MKKIYSLLFIIIFLSIIVSGQTPSFSWVKQFGGTAADEAESIFVDASGNVYTAGGFNGTADFDPGIGTFNMTSAGNSDIFISKLDVNGNFVWAKQMGGTGSDDGLSITLDNSGNIYITGYFSGTVDFDPNIGTFNLTSLGSFDIFILKLDATGNFVWAKSMGASGVDRGYSISVDGSGNVYTTGYFNLTVDFDPGVGVFNMTSAGSLDGFISKLDASGNFVWAKQMGGTGGDYCYSITNDVSGNVYIEGAFAATVDFDPGAGVFNMTSAGSLDIFIFKLNSSGNFAWAKQMGGTGQDVGFSLTLDISGNIYLTGTFIGTGDFDPGVGVFNLTSFGGNDIFISKLDAAGNFVWAKQMGGTSTDIGNSISVDSIGNAYISGLFIGTADFDPGAGVFNMTSVGLQDVCVSKLDALGNFVWAVSFGGVNGDRSNAIAVDVNQNVYTTGYFDTGTADFDPGVGVFNVTSFGGHDVFVEKLCQQIPSPGSITGTAIICSGSSNTYSVVNDPAATSYTWVLPSGWTGTSTTNSINTTASATSGNITVTANNACGSSTPQTLAITVNDVPSQPSIIIGNASFCEDSTAQAYSVTNDAAATSYTWTLPGGWAGTSTTNSINSTAGAAGGTITVTANNGCGSSTVQTLTITVNPLPTVVAAGTATICNGQSTNISASGASTYTWDNGAGTGSPVAVSPNTTTTYTVTGTDGNSCQNTDQVTITVIPLPDTSVVQVSNVLTAQNVNAGVTYQWLDCNNSFTAISGETNQNYTATANGNYAVEVTENGCADTSSCYSVIGIGIEENDFNDNFIVYPNPNNGIFSVEVLNTNEEVTINITDLRGRIITNFKSTNSLISIDLNNEPKGIYYLQIATKKVSLAQKIIIQ